MSTTAENLEKAFALFGPDGGQWTRWNLSRDFDTGAPVCYCTVGALNKALVGDALGPKRPSTVIPGVSLWDSYRTTPEIVALAAAAREQLDEEREGEYDWENPASAVAEFNDNIEIFADVKRWWERAIEIARESE